MAKPSKPVGIRERISSWLVPAAAAGAVGYVVLTNMNNSEYDTHPVTCAVGVPKKVSEGKVDPARPFSEFSVTSADGKSVARIVVAASVDKGKVPIEGMQVLRSKSVPKGDAQKPTIAPQLEGSAVLANPADTTNFNFVDGKGQTAILALDAKNTIEINVTQDSNRTSAQLSAACIGK
ncbi:MAG: hypothetical protein WAW63_00220 [Candidatus Saccharimonadales bacterium]|jgi:hypothetical protein|nr:hypothetical protein [Candidatus Saccharibacteria bacterium]